MNEIYFFSLVGIVILSAIAASRLGLVALQVTAVAIALSTTIIAGHVIEVFGVKASAGTATFIGLFLVIDLVSEIYGKREAVNTIKYTFASNLLLMLIGLISTQLSSAEPTVVGQSLNALFAWVPRLIAGGLIAFAVSQYVDVLLFFIIKKLSGEKWLWLRVSGSTCVSQAVDTILVWTIAFYGVIPNLWQVILAAYATKLVGALIEIPASYLARHLNRDYKNARP